MANLEKYILQAKENTKDFTDIEKLRYVYLNLGKKFVFDLDFSFGNIKAKQKIYYESGTKAGIEESFERGIAICKSIAKVYQYVMKALGIDIEIVIDDNEDRKYPHVYNTIKWKDGKNYILDLQADMKNIKSNLRTSYFGICEDDEMKTIINRKEIEKIDEKLGYITKSVWYTDEYLELIKTNMDLIDDFEEKVEFALEETEIYTDKKIGYADRRWRMEEIIGIDGKNGVLFSKEESRKIHIMDCYKEKDGKKEYILGIVVDSGGKSNIYLFSDEKNKFEKKSLEEFADLAMDGLVYKRGIQGLNKILREKKEGPEPR